MTASQVSNSQVSKSPVSRKQRSSEGRGHAPARPSRQFQEQQIVFEPIPAAGAHAAQHLINEDATPGAGVLPSCAHNSGREVDGAAG